MIRDIIEEYEVRIRNIEETIKELVKSKSGWSFRRLDKLNSNIEIYSELITKLRNKLPKPTKKVYTIDVATIPEDEIEDYIKSIVQKFKKDEKVTLINHINQLKLIGSEVTNITANSAAEDFIRAAIDIINHYSKEGTCN